MKIHKNGWRRRSKILAASMDKELEALVSRHSVLMHPRMTQHGKFGIYYFSSNEKTQDFASKSAAGLQNRIAANHCGGNIGGQKNVLRSPRQKLSFSLAAT
jgi:hypothetical protein